MTDITTDLLDSLLQFIEDHLQGTTREEIKLAFMGVDTSQMNIMLWFLERHGMIRSQYFITSKKKKGK